MIDTDKYEGHIAGPWKNEGGDIYAANGEHIADTVLNMVIPQEEAHANTQLIADAPLLLAEVKRLRGGISKVADNMAKLVEAYSSHLADEEVADWIGGFIKDMRELNQ